MAALSGCLAGRSRASGRKVPSRAAFRWPWDASRFVLGLYSGYPLVGRLF
jgi:hypothetical protein